MLIVLGSAVNSIYCPFCVILYLKNNSLTSTTSHNIMMLTTMMLMTMTIRVEVVKDT